MTDFSAGQRMSESSFDATLTPVNRRDAELTSDRSSFARRASRRIARFLTVVCFGVGATLAWQSYGNTVHQMIADWARQQGWSSLLPAMILPPIDGIAGEQPRQPVEAPAKPPALELPQLETITRDLAAMRQDVEQLAADQQQIAREIAKLRDSEPDIWNSLSVAPPGRPAARKPVPVVEQPSKP